MADKRISELTSGTAQSGDLLAVARAGDNFRVSASSIAALATYGHTQTLVVDVGGNDSTGDGSHKKPFATIQAAVDAATADFTGGEHVMIQVMPGNYGGNITIARPRTHIMGFGDGVTKLVRNAGQVTINQTAAANGVYEDVFSISNMLLVSSSGTVLTLAGSAPYSFFSRSLYCYSDTAAVRCLNVTNTALTGIKVDCRDGRLQNDSSNVPVADFNNTFYGILQRMNISTGVSAALNITTSNMFVTLCELSTQGSTDLISVASGFGTQFNPITAPAGSVALAIGNSTLSSTATNGNGINIAAAAAVNAAYNAFSIRAGTGFAVKGVSGSFFINGSNSMVPGTNVRISSAIGAGNIPYTNSFTAA